MERVAMAVPVKPGKTEAVRHYIAELTGPRAEDDAAYHRKVGVQRQTVWRQETAAGEFLIIYQEVDDPGRMRARMEELDASDDPHLAWKRDQYRELYDIDPDAGPPRPLELLADREF